MSNPLTKITVMLVEADEAVRTMLHDVLKSLGFTTIILAENGIEAIRLLRETPVDMMITDWELRLDEAQKQAVTHDPEWDDHAPVNGAALVRYLRRHEASPDRHLPIIMLTGPTLPHASRYAYDAGVNEQVTKPLLVEELCARITDLVESPQAFIRGNTVNDYSGPCRRHVDLPWHEAERRQQEVRVIDVSKTTHHKKRGNQNI